MGVETAVDMGRESLFMAVKLGFIPLAVGLVVGLLIAILQTVTQIQEQTLAILPKALAVIIVLYVCMPWLLDTLLDYTVNLFTIMPTLK